MTNRFAFDLEQLIYLRSRGLPLENARASSALS